MGISLWPAGLLLLALAAACGPPEEPHGRDAPAAALGTDMPRQRYNLVLLTLDTVRADALGAYGRRRDTTPNIDALAKEGLLFERCETSSPSTLPSHATIFTARYPHQHGVRGNAGYVLSPERVTLAELMRASGYRTAAEVAAPVLSRQTGIGQGFESFRDLDSGGTEVSAGEDRAGPAPAHAPRERRAKDVTDRGIEFVSANRHVPFFLWLHYFDAHAPNAPPGSSPMVARAERYHAEVHAVDVQIGRMMDALAEVGVADRTLVVVSADHGEGLGDHGESHHSFFVYETTMHVPLILWAPGLLAPGRVDAPVRTADIAPTILDLLGLPALADVVGVSLVPLARGGQLALTGYGESSEHQVLFGSSILRFVRDGSLKYIHKLEPELYDLANDPGELTNLAETRPEEVARLRTRLASVVDSEVEADPGPAPLEADRAGELAALGYAVGGIPRSRGSDPLALRGPDPGAKRHAVDLYAKGWGEYGGGHYARAESRFRELLAEGGGQSAVFGLVSSLYEQGKRKEALETLARELDGNHAAFHLGLADLAEEKNATADSERILEILWAAAPCERRPRARHALLLSRAGRYADLVSLLGESVERCPESVGFRNDYAWVLATLPESELRNGPLALELASALVADSDGQDPNLLDTLAAAQAECGDFEGAVATSREALARVEAAAADPRQIALFRAHLAELEAGRPLRD